MELGIPEILDAAIEAKSVVTLIRPELSEPEILCIPAARSNELLLVYVFYDFCPDGFRVIRIDDVTEILREESELFFERILASEGVYHRLRIPAGIDLSSWRSVFESLKGRYDYCTLESDEQDDFLIGKVVEISDWELSFRYFDAAGKWDEDPEPVDYDDLSAAGFDDRYTNTIIKYLPPLT